MKKALPYIILCALIVAAISAATVGLVLLGGME